MECNDLYTSVEQRLLSSCAFCHFLYPQGSMTTKTKKSVNHHLNISSSCPWFPSFLLSVASHLVWCYRVDLPLAIARNLTLFIRFLYIFLPCGFLFSCMAKQCLISYLSQAHPLFFSASFFCPSYLPPRSCFLPSLQ